MKAVAAKLGIGAAETVRTWVRKSQVDSGQPPGVTSEEAELDRPSKRSYPSSTRTARCRSRADLPSPDQPRAEDRDEHLLRRQEADRQRPDSP